MPNPPKKIKGAVVPTKNICDVAGCNKKVQRNGKCWSHLKAAGINPKTGKPAVDDPSRGGGGCYAC